ncbi:hypothetical protein BKA93DRAFT_816689 [Sparassis latifolia]|uniref:F-box domain-containing protein n=1 Tax=Sparassis crispa TaxID=139825 RepID=A0A401GCL9_9APHY|nr:hypothetical protein SCP_0211040 [Sparassis crispa]GBE79902.1 hypothetical protein SCP_0211040 [Sparassis crispa]
MPSVFESLPVELIADILTELDLTSLVIAAYLSRRLHAVSSDTSLNPWRGPILRTLRNPDGSYEPCLKHLSVRSVVPRLNFVEILSIARAPFLLFDATLPNLRESEWELCFRRRFLPGWAKVKKDCTWREAFVKMLHRVWHRSHSSCTTDEAWTNYIVLNRNGTANQLAGSSRNFNVLTISDQLKVQSNLMHLDTRVRVLVEFADVRILAIGVLNHTTTSLFVNPNARELLHPPGIEKEEEVDGASVSPSSSQSSGTLNQTYRRLAYPHPSPSHENYPFHTPGGEDVRWVDTEELEEKCLQWVGSMMLTAQLLGPHTKETQFGASPVDFDLVVGSGRSQYASLTFDDLMAVAPWLNVTKWIEGPGLGH